jgi:DNA-binding MltR family transcriptional regulator
LTVSPVISGKADDIAAQLQEQFTDLNTLSKELNLDSDEQAFSVARIHSRMSDRAANEKKVTRLQREEKQEILQTMDNWNEMRVAEKNEQSSIHSFICAAHKINNMALAMTSASAKF